MTETFDVLVAGGGILGLSTAWNLSQRGVRVALVEQKHPGYGSTGRCIGGIRQQFSTPGAIRLMKKSVEIFSSMKDLFGFSVDFYQGGYLFLAHDERMAETFRKNREVQLREGLSVSLLTPSQTKDVVPLLETEGLVSAAYCPSDGQASPFLVMKGYWKGLKERGALLRTSTKLASLEKRGSTFHALLSDGTRWEAARVVLSLGPWAREFTATLGLDIPCYPERHEAAITQRLERMIEPMIVDYRREGSYFHQLVTGQIIICYTPEETVPELRYDSTIDFLPEAARRMAKLVPALGPSPFLRQWAGCYTVTPDHSPIVDQTPIEGLFLAAGMSGHGFMFGPGLGWSLAERIVTGEWPLDLSEFRYGRSFDSTETMR